MKRTFVKAMTAVTILTVSASMPFTAMAAKKICLPNNGAVVIMGGNGNFCWDSQGSITGKPGSGTPDINIPNINFPDFNIPDINFPDFNIPDMNNPNINIPGFGDTENDGSGTTDGAVSNSEYVNQVLTLVNEERAKSGLSPLTLDAAACDAAQTRAREIVSNFSHTRPGGKSFSTALTESGVKFRSAGENIAYGQTSPSQVMNGWMNSSGHRANIMNKNYTKIGIAHYEDASGTDYWVQLFFN